MASTTQLKKLTREEVEKVRLVFCSNFQGAGEIDELLNEIAQHPGRLGMFCDTGSHALTSEVLSNESLSTLCTQWVIIDSKVYNLSRFKDLHPGGISVLLDPEVGTSAAHHLLRKRLADPRVPPSSRHL